MKKTTRMIAVILTLALMLSLGVSALADNTAGSGLTVFEDVSNMTGVTFTDVPTSYWAFKGIKTCYDKGIIFGYSDDTYKPGSYVTWAHAIAIAARLHSTYYGNAVRPTAAGETWFGPDYEYCKAHNMIPTDCPATLSAMAATPIPRYGLAYLFSRTVDDVDLPAISNRQITDLASIPAQYVDSVKRMYASGIITGYSDFSFGGSKITTRAHMAEVVARILMPAQRVGYDSGANLDMASCQANLENDSIAVKVGDLYYCLYKYSETPNDQRFALYATDGADFTRELYTAPTDCYLECVSAYQGKVYFAQNTRGAATGSLLCYDPAADTCSVVYEGCLVDAYCFYDGELFALLMTEYGNSLDAYRYDFGKIAYGSFILYYGGFGYAEVSNFQPYGWNGKIYFKLNSGDNETNLFSCDIATGRYEQVSDANINTSFFDGHVMYYLAFDKDGNYDRNLYAISLQAPAVVKTIGEFAAGTNVRYRSLYKYENTYYCLSSFNGNLYSMNKDGSSRLDLICGGVYNSLCFIGDKAALIPNNLIVDNPNEIKLYNSKNLSARSLYGDWIGLSCYYEGARFVPEDGASIYTSEESVSTVTNLSITVPEAFSRGDDFVVRTKYTNNTDSAIKLRSYVVKIYLNNTLVAYNINRMSGYELDDHGIQTFTFVIAGADVFRDFDVSDGRVSIEIIPTYDVVQEESVS